MNCIVDNKLTKRETKYYCIISVFQVIQNGYMHVMCLIHHCVINNIGFT